MVIYTVQEPPRPARSLDERADGVVFIKEGFTFWGFFFGVFWLLYYRLWFEFAAAILVLAGLGAFLGALGLGREAGVILSLFVMLFVGFEGNDLRRWRLHRKGYVFLASVAGRSLIDCERRFFDAWLPHVAGPMPKALPPSPPVDPRQAPPSGGGWRGPSAVGTLPGIMV